ncbi:MAG TPA: DUF5666 domain-containing protein [Vicinamibacterales bacterium]|nr:DUF5666 domain-containing protein [Vicinamibacterales bacterium]
MRTWLRVTGVLTGAALLLSSVACGGSPAAPAPVAATGAAQTSPDAPPPAPPPPAAPQGGAASAVNLHGVVSHADVDARTLRVDSTTVRATDTTAIATTEGTSLSFADVVTGTTVHVKGTLDGAVVVATSIAVRDARISGTVGALAGTCPEVTFVVGGRQVATGDATSFGPGECADLADGLVVDVKGLFADGVLTATRVELPRPHHQTRVDLSGAIAGLAGECPAPAFRIGSTAVSVTGETEYARGTCADLADGIVVDVKGERASDGSVVALSIAFEKPHAPGPQPPTPHEDVEFSGTITAVAGECPAAVLTVGGATIRLSEATHFPGSGCGGAIVGASVDGRGVAQEDGSIAATRLHIKKGPSAPPQAPKSVTIEGAVTGVSGTCPALSFTLAGRTVQTTAATNFVGSGNCGVIVNGKTIEVTGTELDGVVTATRVKVSK